MDTPARPQFRVRMLGEFQLSNASGKSVVAPGKKLRALIALLGLPPAGSWTRDHLTDLLWGDRDEHRARGSLRQALVELRRILGSSAVSIDRERVALNASVVAIDAVEFLNFVTSEKWHDAAALYQGELLEGVNLADTGFADWLLVERNRMRDLAIETFSHLLAQQTGATAIATAQRLLQLDRTHEATHRALMRLYSAQGDRSQALRQYQICRGSLEQELGVGPESATRQLYEELQSPSIEDPPKPERSWPSEALTGSTNVDNKWSRRLRMGGMSRTRTFGWVFGAVLSLAVVGTTMFHLVQRGSSSPLPTDKPAVAVLPFESLADDEGSRRLAKGLTKDIIADLSRFPELRVIAHNSTKIYAARPVELSEIRAALKVGFVVEGSVQREGNRLRITTQLVDTGTGRNLWSERWDRPDTDFFAVQSEISGQLTNRLGGGAGLIQGAGRQAAHHKSLSNLSAYELYLLGTEQLEKIDQVGAEEAVGLLTRSATIDPSFARAWVELFHAYDLLASFGIQPENNNRLAAAAAMRAVELDPSDAEAHAVLGISLGRRGELSRAKIEWDIALNLAPGAAEILTLYSAWAATFGEPQRGADMVDLVIEVNPNFPLWNAKFFSFAYFVAGRYEAALAMIERLEPSNYSRNTWAMHAASLAALGRYDEARIWRQNALEALPDLAIEAFAYWDVLPPTERQRFVDTMRLAEFPPCLDSKALVDVRQEMRIEECRLREVQSSQ